ncbi:MAG: shikimate kinase [Candidatus Aquicultorales bacterium]
MKQNIVLIGFMGSGKSTVGRRLARRLGYGFVDTDQAVEAKAGKRIVDIFEEDGEAVFRAFERQAIEKAASGEGRVIACGGGAVMDPSNVEVLRRNGVLVYLKASEEALLERLRRGFERRPLLRMEDAEGRVKELLDQRAETYESVAGVIVDTEKMSPSKVVEVIANRLGVA